LWDGFWGEDEEEGTESEPGIRSRSKLVWLSLSLSLLDSESEFESDPGMCFGNKHGAATCASPSLPGRPSRQNPRHHHGSWLDLYVSLFLSLGHMFDPEQ